MLAEPQQCVAQRPVWHITDGLKGGGNCQWPGDQGGNRRCLEILHKPQSGDQRLAEMAVDPL